MNVHFDKKIVFLHHQCVGSTATVPLLLSRGFERLGGHHDGPWNLGPHKDQDYYRWWTDRPENYYYVFTVRNPFSTILSHWWQWGEPEGGRGLVTVEFLNDFMIRGIKYRPQRGRMFRFYWELLPGMKRVLFQEKLEEDLALFFDSQRLPALSPGELQRENVTRGKPTENLASYFTSGAIDWINRYHHDELMHLGYSLKDLP
jgi:hypothetical protein